jgi:hypothetical protein
MNVCAAIGAVRGGVAVPRAHPVAATKSQIPVTAVIVVRMEEPVRSALTANR